MKGLILFIIISGLLFIFLFLKKLDKSLFFLKVDIWFIAPNFSPLFKLNHINIIAKLFYNNGLFVVASMDDFFYFFTVFSGCRIYLDIMSGEIL